MSTPTYNAQFTELRHHFTAMASSVRQLMKLSTRTLQEREMQLLEEARNLLYGLRDHKDAIEELTTQIIKLHSPMGEDLRLVTMAMGIASALARVGELCRSTVRHTLELGDYKAKKTVKSLTEMAAVGLKMLDHIVSMLESSSAKHTGKVLRSDHVMDELYHRFFDDIREIMAGEPEHVLHGMHLLFAAKNFERMGDYIEEVAETLYYIYEGQKVIKTDA